MNIQEIKAIILKASEGMYLTQSADIPDEGRIIADTICLNSAEDVSNWKEITVEEGNTIKKLQEELANKTITNE